MSRLDDDFQKLLQILQSPEASNMKVEEMTQFVMTFFQQLQKEMQTASPQEKAELMSKMNEMYRLLLGATRNITKKLGMNEEDLMNFAEDPSNFTPEQWKAMQDARKMLINFGTAISKTSAEFPQSLPPKAPSHPKKDEQHPKKKSDRSKWMRS